MAVGGTKLGRRCLLIDCRPEREWNAIQPGLWFPASVAIGAETPCQCRQWDSIRHWCRHPSSHSPRRLRCGCWWKAAAHCSSWQAARFRVNGHEPGCFAARDHPVCQSSLRPRRTLNGAQITLMDFFHVQFEMGRSDGFGDGSRRRARDLAAVGSGLISGRQQRSGQRFWRDLLLEDFGYAPALSERHPHPVPPMPFPTKAKPDRRPPPNLLHRSKKRQILVNGFCAGNQTAPALPPAEILLPSNLDWFPTLKQEQVDFCLLLGGFTFGQLNGVHDSQLVVAGQIGLEAGRSRLIHPGGIHVNHRAGDLEILQS